MLNDIVEVKPVGGYRLYLRFDDDVNGEIDISEIIQFRGIFEQLKDQDKFQQVSVNPDLGTVCWPNGADIAPEFLYAKLTGK